MNRTEFMKRLEFLLQDISDSEREEALRYYEDYFDDAGEENEAKVIEELGSPEQVALKIKSECPDSASEYSEQGYKDTRFHTTQEVISKEAAERAGRNNANGTTGNMHKKSETNVWKLIFIIISVVIAAPIIFSLGAAVLSTVFAVVLGIGGTLVGILFAGITMLILGLVLIGAGIVQIFIMPAIGFALAGAGCLLFALGIVISLLTFWCCVKIFPGLIRGIVKLIKYPLRKAGVCK